MNIKSDNSGEGLPGAQTALCAGSGPRDGIEGMERAFGRSVQRSEIITAQLIDCASSEGMWILLHADLKDMVNSSQRWSKSSPDHFNIPHFGSRGKGSPL